MNMFAALADSDSDASDAELITGVDRDVDASPELRECRICHEEGPVSDFICPCDCTGSMRFVHAACLNMWRTANVANMTHCNVCHARYNDAVGEGADIGIWRWIRHKAARAQRQAVWRRTWQAVVVALERGRSPACCSARLVLQLLFLLACVVQGRFVLLWGAHVLRMVLDADARVDQLLFPTALLSWLHSTFKPLNCWDEIQSHSIGASTRALRIELHLGDLFVGAFFASLNSHLLLLWRLQRGQRPPVLPCPVHDAADLWEWACPEPLHAASLCIVGLPGAAYAGRFWLANLGVLAMDAKPLSFVTGENVALHMLLAFIICTQLIWTCAIIEMAASDYLEWALHEQMASIGIAVPRRRRRRRRRNARNVHV